VPESNVNAPRVFGQTRTLSILGSIVGSADLDFDVIMKADPIVAIVSDFAPYLYWRKDA